MTQLTRLRTVASLERAREYSYRLQQFSFHSCTNYHVHGTAVYSCNRYYYGSLRTRRGFLRCRTQRSCFHVCLIEYSIICNIRLALCMIKACAQATASIEPPTYVLDRRVSQR